MGKAAASEFQSVHDRFRPRVLRYLKRLVGESEAEDLAQSVMLKVSEGLPRFRGDASLSTWIYRIATNAALDRLRLKTMPLREEAALEDAGSDEPVVPPGARAPSAESAAIRDEMNACIREFIERLPDNYKAVMVLSDLEGFANDEIAAILGISLETVKIRLHRAREKLRRELAAGCDLSREDGDGLSCDRKQPATVTLRRRR